MGRKKLSTQFGLIEANVPVTGIFAGVRELFNDEGEVMRSKKYGTDLYIVGFKNPENTDDVAEYFCDAGLRGELKRCKVKEGDKIEVMWTGKHNEWEGEDGKPRRAKVYEIYALT